MRTTLLLAAVLGGALPALTAPAQMVEMPPGKWWKRPAAVEVLKISAEQQQRLDEVFAKHRRAFVDLKADVERRSIDLEDLLAARDVDPRRVAAASDALEQARGRLGKARTMMVVEMRGILTAEQWTSIVDRREEFRAERKAEMRRRLLDRRPAGRSGTRPALPTPLDEPEKP